MVDQPGRYDETAAIAQLKTMDSTQQAQITIEGLQKLGWTIPALCDLEIDGDIYDLPEEVRYLIRYFVKYEWIMAREAVRGQLAVAEGLSRLEAAIRSLEATIVAGRPKPSTPGAIPAKAAGK